MKNNTLLMLLLAAVAMLSTCKPIDIKDQNFTVKVTIDGQSGRSQKSISDTIKHIVKNDVNERLVTLSAQNIERLDSIKLEFTTREGLPYSETYYSITTFDEPTVSIGGSSIFTSFQTFSGDDWVKPRLGKMVVNELRFNDISDRKTVMRFASDSRFKIHGETFMFRKHDSDIVIPTNLADSDRRCLPQICLDTDTLSTIIFSQLTTAIGFAFNGFDIPATDVSLKNGTGNCELYLVPHVSAIPSSNRRIKGFGFIFKVSIDVKPLGLITSHEVDVFVPIFIAFEKNSNTQYRVMLLPPNISNILTVTDKVAVGSTGLFSDQIAATIKDRISSTLTTLNPPSLIPSVSNDEIFSLLFDVLRESKPIPDNFDVIALPTTKILPSNKVIDETGITARYEIVFLEK